MKHILFIVTNADKVGSNNHKTGYEFSEIADPYLEFTKVKFTVDFASINGGSPQKMDMTKTIKTANYLEIAVATKD